MNTQSLNLLRYPRRARWQESALLRPAGLAWLAGALVGGAWAGWQHTRQEQLEQQRTQLQARLQAVVTAQARLAADQARARLHEQLAGRAQAWQNQRAQLRQLHAALIAQTKDNGLQLERWQGDGRQLLLQAWLPHAQSVPVVLMQLSAAAPAAWSLHSLADRGGGGVEVVLQAPWIALSEPQAQPKP